MNAWKLNTDLAAVAEQMRPIETIRRRLDVPMETWARWMGMTREHYSALVNGRVAPKYHRAHVALAWAISREYRHWKAKGKDQAQLLEKLETLFG